MGAEWIGVVGVAVGSIVALAGTTWGAYITDTRAARHADDTARREAVGAVVIAPIAQARSCDPRLRG